MVEISSYRRTLVRGFYRRNIDDLVLSIEIHCREGV